MAVHDGRHGQRKRRSEDNVVLLPGETRHPAIPARRGKNLCDVIRRTHRKQSAFAFSAAATAAEADGTVTVDAVEIGADAATVAGGDRGGRGRFEPRRSGSGGGAPSHGGHQRAIRAGTHGHAPPRRPQLISEMLKAGQEIVVQIAKEPLGKKGARITSHVALPGRFLVYMPTIDHIGVSRKIASAENRSRLRRLVTEARGSYPGGFIVRTAAGEATDEEIRTDIEFLGRTWNEIKQKSEERKAPALLHRDLNLVERILRDYVSDDFTAIWIDNEEEFGKVVEFVSRFQPKLVIA